MVERLVKLAIGVALLVTCACDDVPLAQSGDDFRTRHAHLDQNEPGDERRAIESHAAMREHAMALADQGGREPCDCAGLDHVRQLLVVVVDGKVDVEAAVGCGGDAGVEAALEIDHRVDFVARERVPIVNRGRDEQSPVVVHGIQFHRSRP